MVFLPACLVGLALPLIWPDIRSVAAFAYRDDHAWSSGLIDGLAGAGAGLLLGGLGSWCWLRLRGEWQAIAPLAWSCAVGIVLGWQRTLYALPASIVVCLLAAYGLRAFRRSESSEIDAQPSGERARAAESTHPSEETGAGVFGGDLPAKVEGDLPPKNPGPI
jgi:hypothetical protein